jgi:hypothetical protein
MVDLATVSGDPSIAQEWPSPIGYDQTPVILMPNMITATTVEAFRYLEPVTAT